MINDISKSICDTIYQAVEKKNITSNKDMTYLCTVTDIYPGDPKTCRLTYEDTDYTVTLNNITPKVYDEVHLVIPQGDFSKKYVLEDACGKYTTDSGATYPPATQYAQGLMSAEDKKKLDRIDENSQPNVQADWNETDEDSDAYINNKPDSMPASDVHEWAKAETKPEYTKEEIGLDKVPNVTTDNQTPSFTEAEKRTNIITGETLSALFGKIAKWFSDLKTVAFSGSYKDLSDKPTIPAVGNGTITLKQNGTSKGTFTMNQSGDTEIELTDTQTITGVKGNAETSYRTGNINITPANIGLGNVNNTSDANKPVSTAQQTALNEKLNISGGEMTGELRFGKGSMVSRQSGVSGTDGYVKCAQIKILSTYQNYPIIFEITGRGWKYSVKLYISFESVNNKDPNLQSVLIDNTTPYKVAIAKSATSTWDIYMKKSEAYGQCDICSLHNVSGNSNIGITFPNELVSSLPSGYIEPTVVTWNQSKNADTVDGKHASDLLNKSGDTMSGTISSSKTTNTYINGNLGNAIINSTATAGKFTMLDKLNSTNGYFTDGVYGSSRVLHYASKSIVDAGINEVSSKVVLLNESGNSSFSGTVTAPTFSGNLSGNASSASKLGTTTVGSAGKPIYLNGGTPTACSGIAVYKELTQAQYDALSSSAKMNGTIYFIKDAN